jgi:N-acetylglucosaminyldiphosphoundecaprenol N-acetyl-beta-D-mannosaminyltransferase
MPNSLNEKIDSTCPTVEVLEVKLFAGSLDHACAIVTDTIGASINRTNRCISATGAHGIIYAKKNNSFKAVLDSFYLNLPDGMPGVWVGRLKGARKMRRCYGPDFFQNLMIKTASLPIKHFLCGGKPGVAEELKMNCLLKFSNSNVVGTYSPPFRPFLDEDFRQLADRINEFKPDIIWIGLSTPKQESFASNLSKYSNSHFVITVGAAFDFHTNKVKQAPRWVQQVGMEWLFRLLMEPKRLYKRYLEIVPLFIYYNFKEIITFALLNRKK